MCKHTYFCKKSHELYHISNNYVPRNAMSCIEYNTLYNFVPKCIMHTTTGYVYPPVIHIKHNRRGN